MSDDLRNFDEEYNLTEKTGPSFVLAGHTFRTKGHVHPSAFLGGLRGVARSVSVVRAFIVDDDQDAFNKIINDPNSLVDSAQLDEIGGWLIEKGFNRPTDASDSSGSGDAKSS